jgi:hypothetical protein
MIQFRRKIAWLHVAPPNRASVNSLSVTNYGPNRVGRRYTLRHCSCAVGVVDRASGSAAAIGHHGIAGTSFFRIAGRT